MSFYPSYQSQFDLLNKKQRRILQNIPHLEQIDGWLLLVEAIELYSLSSLINSSDPIICEIGTWKGKSAYVFATVQKNKKGVLYCVDPFNGDGDDTSKKTYQGEIKNLKMPLIKNFERTMKKYDLWSAIKLLPFLSEDARPRFNESKIDLLFIDGNHDYKAVEKDYKLWSPLIPKGGVIILHDVKAAHVDGPKLVMEEYIESNKMWKNARIVGEMGIAIKV